VCEPFQNPVTRNVNRLVVFSIVLVFPFLSVLPRSEQKSRRHANRPPSIESFTSSLTTIRICPFYPTSAVSDKPEVTLVVKAIDPDGDSLSYEYSTTEGTISGEGRSVLWHLDGLPRGPHEVHVTVSDRKGGKATGALTVTTVDASACDPPPPPCPVIKIKVLCPDEMDHSRPFIFSAFVEDDAKSPTPLTFHWKINAGRIVKGQYSREVEVTTKDAFGFDNITATVEVAAADPSCAVTIVSCTTKIIW
jgi:hypothetical protein